MADVFQLTDDSQKGRTKLENQCGSESVSHQAITFFDTTQQKPEATRVNFWRCWGGGHDERKAALNQTLSVLHKSEIFFKCPRCAKFPPFVVKPEGCYLTHMNRQHVPCIIYYRHREKHITKVNVIFKHFKITIQQYVKDIIYFTAQYLFLLH